MYTNVPVVSDNLTLYLAEIKKFPVLDEVEEQRLARMLYEEKNLAAAQTLITSNLRFVVRVASEYKNYGLRMLDLIQEGNIGLMMAVKKFNPYKGFRLISYAVWWIRAYIQNYIVSAWSLVKIGTTQAQRKLFFKLKQAKQAIMRMDGDSDEGASAAQLLDVSEAEVNEMEQRLLGELSLDVELSQGEGVTFLETIVDERPNQEVQLSDIQEHRKLQLQVESALSRLSEKERYVVEHRISADEPMTLQEIAQYFSISRERVRQIEENALRKVRAFLTPLLAASHA